MWPVEEEEPVPTYYELRLAHFLTYRINEANLFQNLQLTPDNVPYNCIAHWRMGIWQAYLAGSEDERTRQQSV